MEALTEQSQTFLAKGHATDNTQVGQEKSVAFNAVPKIGATARFRLHAGGNEDGLGNSKNF